MHRPLRLGLPVALFVVSLAFSSAASASGTLHVAKSPTATAGGVVGTHPRREEGTPGVVTAISCGSVCTAFLSDYQTCIDKPTGPICATHDETVRLTASPAAGWSFAGWSGDCSGASACSATMHSNRSVTATFADVAAPAVGFIGPPQDSELRASVGVGATATDNWGVSRVEFLLDGTLVATDANGGDGWGTTIDLAGKPHGDHITIVARAWDPAGRPSDAARGYVIDRRVAGAFMSPTPDEGAWVTSGAPQIRFTTDDDTIARECRTTLDGAASAWSPCSSPFTPSTASDGRYAVEVRITDDAGNQDVLVRRFNVDRHAPSVRIITPADGSYRNSGFVPAFDVSGAAATCAQDGEPFGPCAPVGLLANGAHELQVKGRDAAGNETVATSRFTVDTVEPAVTFTGGTPQGAILDRPQAEFRFSATDAAPLVHACRLDDSGAAACDEPDKQIYDRLADGPHRFTLGVTDAAGNRTELTRGFTVNAVKPTVRITSGPEDGAASAARAVTFGFDAAGAIDVACAVDSATDFRPCTAATAHTLTDLADGPHEFRVRARDESDDTAVAARTFRIDTSSPETTIVAGPAQGSSTPASRVTFAFESSAPGSSYRCRFASGSFGPCSGPGATHHVKRLAPGRYVFEVQAVSPLGTADPTPARRAFTLVKPGPPFRVNYLWTIGPDRTRVDALTLKNLSPTARVTVTCAGDSCPLARKRLKVTNGKTKLGRLFGDAELTPGTRIALRVTLGSSPARIIRFTVRKGRQPMREDLCLPRGAPKPRAC